jgi:hypothetical protein
MRILVLLLFLVSYPVLGFGPEHGVVVPVPQGFGVHTVSLYQWDEFQSGWFPLASLSVVDEVEVRFDVAKLYSAPFPQGTVIKFRATALNSHGESTPSEELLVLYDWGVWFCGDFWSPSGGWCHQ